MRERVTYVQKLGDSLEPSALTVEGGTIKGPEVHAVREDRLTIALNELPTELQTLVAGAQDLHIRWVSTTAYEAVSPLLARLPPGFHFFFTPGKDGIVGNKLCPLLGSIFGSDICLSPNESFTSLPKDTFSHSAAFQYFQQLETLSQFIQYAKGRLCRSTDASCSARLDALSKASSLDISYDTVQHVLRVTALWPYQRQQVHVTSHPQLRTEVGILSTDKPQTLEPHEIGISGLLTVLGQDFKPSPTMFTFASRHRDAESTFSAQFLTPTGLHPTLRLRLASSAPLNLSQHDDDNNDQDTTCVPYAYLTLPRTIFADRYQLSDLLFLASKNLTALRYMTQPVDLEAPEYVMAQWGSSVLLELSPPPPSTSSQPEKKNEREEWTAEIPLHLRYLAPAEGGYSAISVPYPAVFWACVPEHGGVEFPPNPFEKVKLGYDGLFEDGTVFWHVEPRPVGGGTSLVNVVRVPVLDLEKARWVNAGTAVAVLGGFAWVVWKLVGLYMYGGDGVEGEGEKAREKKRQ
ncbi:PIG-X-domain-containing protein [Parathielavia appendiculata]|uniref:Protein PBN1 n=1 Tax=Parathielavia appendiculata TaxID=2587402 RepID=A0AAN6TYW2_9PEZI|nr:PIG-X-domain-containing protein [Parathielavia appendiculata]